MDDQAERMIEVHMDFINAHAKDSGMPDPSLVTREDYEPPELPECHPKVIGDITFPHYTDHRMLTIRVDPYQDEGGPGLLTGFFRAGPEGWDDRQAPDTLLFEFDTEHMVILLNGQYTDAWPQGGPCE